MVFLKGVMIITMTMFVMFLIIYHSAGRVAEPADASWNLSRWDSERCCFEMFWQNRKTLIQQPLNYFPHYSDYKLCIYILVSIPQTRLKSSDLIRSLSKVNIRTYP